jgi:hypothetical protein
MTLDANVLLNVNRWIAQSADLQEEQIVLDSAPAIAYSALSQLHTLLNGRGCKATLDVLGVADEEGARAAALEQAAEQLREVLGRHPAMQMGGKNFFRQSEIRLALHSKGAKQLLPPPFTDEEEPSYRRETTVRKEDAEMMVRADRRIALFAFRNRFETILRPRLTEEQRAAYEAHYSWEGDSDSFESDVAACRALYEACPLSCGEIEAALDLLVDAQEPADILDCKRSFMEAFLKFAISA